MNKLRSIFNPTFEEAVEQNRKFKKIFDEAAKNKGCATCENLRHVIDYPGFVTGEENECTVGLECDTVLFSVKNCPEYKQVEYKDAY